MSSSAAQPQQAVVVVTKGTQQPPSSGTRTSPLVESILTGSNRDGVAGILANDVNGLCLVSKGSMPEGVDSGVYTNLTRLASQLSAATASSNINPLITIELEGPASLLIKEYDGHTVAIKVPNATVSKGDTTTVE